MTLLTLSVVSKSFTSDRAVIEVLDGITFSASTGEVLVLRGSNGCGKTTLLNIIAGLEAPTAGRVSWRNSFAGTPIGYVFQNYSSTLLPWLTLGENIVLPLRLRGLSRREQAAHLGILRETYDLTAVPTNRYPAESSGGQKQRACIARALLCASPAILFDEPFSALDDKGHRNLLSVIEQLRNRERRLVVVVVHDLDDAILLADRLLLVGGAPASVKADVQVDLGRPRSYDQKTTPEFIRLRNLILERELDG